MADATGAVRHRAQETVSEGVIPNAPAQGRILNRMYTWTVMREDGLSFDEASFGSLSAVPMKGHRVARITVWRRDTEIAKARQYHLFVPVGAHPFIFGRIRTQLGGQGAVKEAITCMGYESEHGERVYVWINDQDDVVITHRDLDDIINGIPDESITKGG